MSSLSDLELLAFVFTPLVLTVALVACIWWYRSRNRPGNTDGPSQLLSAAARHMPADRSEWGDAMMAELIYLHGASFRWWFALGCARVALFPPATTAWPRYLFDTIKRLGPVCGILSVALPPLGLPILYFAAVAAEVFLIVDGVSTSEVMPAGVIGAIILVSIACMLSGLPLGIAGLVRREQLRWLSLMGPVVSISIFSYLLIVMHFVAGGPHGD